MTTNPLDFKNLCI